MNNFDIAELLRVVANMIGTYVVSSVDIKSYSIRVFIDEGKESAEIAVLRRKILNGHGDSHLPEKGEQVLILAPNGDFSQGVCVGSIGKESDSPNSKNWGKTFPDGTTITYDEETKTLKAILEGGSLDLSASKGVKIVGDLSLEGELSISKGGILLKDGDLNAEKGGILLKAGDLNAQKGQVVAFKDVIGGTVSLAKHTHSIDVPKPLTLIPITPTPTPPPTPPI